MNDFASQLLHRARAAEDEATELRRRAVGYVILARHAGATWADVGAAFGVTRQSAHERFSAGARRQSTQAVTRAVD